MLSEQNLIALARANLRMTVKGVRSGKYEVRKWYSTWSDEYEVEYVGDWDGCIAYLRAAYSDWELRMMDI